MASEVHQIITEKIGPCDNCERPTIQRLVCANVECGGKFCPQCFKADLHNEGDYMFCPHCNHQMRVPI